MVAHDRSNSSGSWPWWRLALMGLSSLALALSAYLGWHSLTGGTVVGCGGGSPCDQVLSSRWSSIGGILPVSGLAAGTYLAMLLAGFYIGPSTEAPVRRLAGGAMRVLAGAILGSVIWFTILQQWIIGSFCPYCMATHLTGLLLAVLVIWKAPRQSSESSADVRRVRFVSALAPVLAGLSLACIMAASQVVITPRAVYLDGDAQESLPAIDPHTVPLIGSPDASSLVTLLFDYKCPHCQQIHFMLEQAVRRFDGKLAIVLCPTPLNTRCNPYIPRDVEEFMDSCELARVSLAVWVADREAFPEFERWMFSFESGDRWRPRTLDAARAKAVELVGQAQFDTAQTDPWIDRYLQHSVQIYGDTGGKAVPKLVFGSRWVIPEPYDSDDLVAILQDTLAVPGP